MATILSFVVLVFGILQIILFFKVWEMTNNVEKITQILTSANKTTDTKNDNTRSMDHDKTSCQQNDEKITFSDGLCGRIKPYPGYPESGVITKDGYELLYNNREAAINALHEYLKNGSELQTELYEKRRVNNKQDILKYGN